MASHSSVVAGNDSDVALRASTWWRSRILLASVGARPGRLARRRQPGRRSSSWSLVGLVLMQAPRIAQQWERAVVLRLGRFVGLRGPGLFWIVPFVDRVSSWIDQRTITTSFAAEQTLTSDTVPVNVDAVLFWMVHDAREGGARSAGLRAGGELGGADRAARHHRPDHADRSAARPRADRGRAAAADRSALEPVGRHGLVGRDARRRHSRRAAGRDVARGAGGAREAGAHHPRRGRDGDRALVRRKRRSRTTTTRRRCTCAR